MRIIINRTGFTFEASQEWVSKNLPSDKYQRAESDPAKVELIKQLLRDE